MNSDPADKRKIDDGDFVAQVTAKAKRKASARGNPAPGVWFGLGMMGLIGWSVVVPTLLGAMLGLWLDANFPRLHSWTLALLVAGLVLGCANAWHWVSQQDQAAREVPRNDYE